MIAESGQASQGGTQHEAGPEHRSQQPEQPGALLGFGQVCGGRPGHRHRRAGGTVHDTPQEHHGQRSGQAGDEAARR